MSMRVAFQGESGAYSEAAALEHFGSDVETLACNSFEQVFASIGSGECHAGMLPIENSLAGSIHRNYDLLLQNTLSVTGEHYLPIHHCLISNPGVELKNIEKVISHPQALAQSDGFLRSLKHVSIEPVYDTAGSVKMIKETGSRNVAAVASRRAAELYGMNILAERIEDHHTNTTRFLAVARDPASPGLDAKTSIVFSLVNQPASLFKAMSVFALRDIDLTKIESRPYIERPWDYLFYIDCVGSTNDPVIRRALAHLDEYATMLRILGSYPRHHLPGGVE